MNKYLQKIKKITNNEYCFIASEEKNIYTNLESVQTDSYILNALLSGSMNVGLYLGKRLLLAGEPSVGKSYLAIFIIKSFLETYKNSVAVYFESEGSSTIEMATSIGIDKDRLLIIPVKTIEETRTISLNILKDLKENNKNLKNEEKQKMIMCCDSISNLSSLKEIGDIESGSDTRDLTKSQLLKAFSRVISLELSMNNVPMIMVAHTYSSLDKYKPVAISSGSGIQYAADIALVLTKGKEKDEGKKQTGVVLTATVRKSRYVREGISAKIILSFSRGLYPFSHLTDIAYENGVFKKEGISFVLPDGSKAKMLDVRKNFKKYANQINMDAIEKEIQRQFKFGQDEEINISDDIEDVEIEGEE